MDECKDLPALVENMEEQGFSEECGENPYWWITLFIVDNPDGKDDEYICPNCGEVTTNKSGTGTCSHCECEGFWIDPAGGIHHETGEFEDPAKMYE
jgi:hypothetical protein